MKKTILICLFWGMGLSFVVAQNDSIPQSPAQQNEAKKIAGKWFSQLVAGKHIDSVMAISAVPFAMDGKKLLSTEKELRDFYQRVVEDKGERKVPEFIAEIHGFKHEIIEKYIPVNVLIVTIRVTGKQASKGNVLVSVGVYGDAPKVIGFSD